MAGMSMEDLAIKLGGLVTKQAISKYEQGQMMPSPEVLERLVEVLKDATWGASPLRAEDALGERQLGLGRPMPRLESPEMPRMGFRRQRLLKRLIQREIKQRKNPKRSNRMRSGRSAKLRRERESPY
ncbi:MAG: helix-turn-helix domain-containing protein [Candidatus Moduliflexus flocculans]|nr:helix-turn-helix domain-containing protein [Candidatus Moduliflexus flocculans]